MKTNNMPRISIRNVDKYLPATDLYRRTAFTSVVRMDGPFQVDTSEGPLVCQDGYLAIDAHGYPYPIDTKEFDMLCQPVQVPE